MGMKHLIDMTQGGDIAGVAPKKSPLPKPSTTPPVLPTTFGPTVEQPPVVAPQPVTAPVTTTQPASVVISASQAVARLPSTFMPAIVQGGASMVVEDDGRPMGAPVGPLQPQGKPAPATVAPIVSDDPLMNQLFGQPSPEKVAEQTYVDMSTTDQLNALFAGPPVTQQAAAPFVPTHEVDEDGPDDVHPEGFLDGSDFEDGDLAELPVSAPVGADGSTKVHAAPSKTFPPSNVNVVTSTGTVMTVPVQFAQMHGLPVVTTPSPAAGNQVSFPVSQAAVVPALNAPLTVDDEIVASNAMIATMQLELENTCFALGIALLSNPDLSDKKNPAHEAIWFARWNPGGLMSLSIEKILEMGVALSVHQVWVAGEENKWTARCAAIKEQLDELVMLRQSGESADTKAEREIRAIKNNPQMRELDRQYTQAKYMAAMLLGMAERFAQLENSFKRPADRLAATESRTNNQGNWNRG
jgi:hypothetical protein